jgi:hypothetical protein
MLTPEAFNQPSKEAAILKESVGLSGLGAIPVISGFLFRLIDHDWPVVRNWGRSWHFREYRLTLLS